MSEPETRDAATTAETVEGDESAAETGEEAEDIRAHLQDVEDGCGCAEVWEHLSDGRE